MSASANESPGKTLALSGLPQTVAAKARPFFEGILESGGERILSIALVGSAVTSDYRPGISDVNSVVVLDRVEMDFLDALAGLGRKYAKKGLAVPLLVTPEYIERSLDSFPLEFLEFQAAHRIVYGVDFLGNLEFDAADVRLAVERELKSLAVNLRRGYLSSLARPRHLADVLVVSFNSVVPVLRGLLYLKGIRAPATKLECVRAASGELGLPADAFESILALRGGRRTPPLAKLREIFRNFYGVLETQSEKIDES